MNYRIHTQCIINGSHGIFIINLLCSVVVPNSAFQPSFPCLSHQAPKSFDEVCSFSATFPIFQT